MNARFVALLALASIVVVAFTFNALEWRYADADNLPALVDAGPEAPPADVAAEPAPPPNPEDDLSWWTSNGWDAARQSVPTAIVLVIFALVGLARRHYRPAREGTTGVVTSTVLAFVTILAASLLAGVSLGTALGAAVAAVLTGRALATQPAKAVG